MAKHLFNQSDSLKISLKNSCSVYTQLLEQRRQKRGELKSGSPGMWVRGESEERPKVGVLL